LQANSRSAHALEACGLTRRYGDVIAVNDVSLRVPAGHVTAILGTSGSGKTTLLRMIAGFEPITHGRVLIGDVDVTDMPPFRRDIGFVFQDHALFPHMTVAQNVEYPLRMRRIPQEKRSALVAHALALAGLTSLSQRRPAQLSGGEQQRTALARAVIFGPRILLMDEPLASLDKRSREQLQHEIKTLQRALKITTIYVTHDQTEAFILGDLVAVMNAGRIVQTASPREIYERPQAEFVARFVGDSNVLTGQVVRVNTEGSTVQFGCGATIRCHAVLVPGQRVSLLVRPEKLTFDSAMPNSSDLNGLEAEITEVLFLGERLEYRLRSAGIDIVARKSNVAFLATPEPGSKIVVTWRVLDTVVLS